MSTWLIPLALILGVGIVLIVVNTLVGKGAEHVSNQVELRVFNRVTADDEARSSARDLIKFYVRRPMTEVSEAIRAECARRGGSLREPTGKDLSHWVFGSVSLQIRLSMKGETVVGVVTAPDGSSLKARDAKMLVDVRRSVLLAIEGMGGRYESRRVD